MESSSLIPVVYFCISLISAPLLLRHSLPVCASTEGESKQGFEVRSLVQLSAELLLSG